MTTEDPLATTESEWDRARLVGARTTQLSGMVGLVTVVAFSVVAYIIGDNIATGWDRYVVAAGLAFAMFAPVVFVLVRSNGTPAKVRAASTTGSIARDSFCQRPLAS